MSKAKIIKADAERAQRIIAAMMMDGGATLTIATNGTAWQMSQQIGDERFVGVAPTLHEAWIAMLHDKAGTEPPPF